ncbi:MAG TPA: hypothetical protein VF614_12370 [Chthoniobacteraceae bacterium]|jgi:putative heme-binding domain-containing protein
MRFLSRIFLLSFLGALTAIAQKPDWIWLGKPGDNEVRYFRQSFTIVGKVLNAHVGASCDDQMTLFINGQEVGKSKAWGEPLKAKVTEHLKGGENVIAVEGKNVGGLGGLVLQLELELEDGKKQKLITNGEWLASAEAKPGWNAPGFVTTGWSKAATVGKFGAEPWGNVFASKEAREAEAGKKAKEATPAEQITVLPGFKVELLRTAQPGEGSWVSIAVDGKGRLYVSPQGREKMLRITLTSTGQIEKVEPLDLPVSAAMGMLWAFDSLYVNGEGPNGSAIYRVRDTNADDVLDEAKLFKAVPNGGGEHGAHALVLGPDKQIYIAHGNSTPLVAGVAAESPYRNYSEENLLPRIFDPVATFFDKLVVPYGYVLRTDENGSKWEVFAGGFRNQYDIDFNADGELFTYDSDMEWDVGLPWYRPTRVYHIPSGGEYGFREGSAKWPEYYPDSVPTTVDVGLGSPTGVKFGTASNYPEKYRRAFFAMDWTYGRILAVHLQPKGASYTAANPLPNPYKLDQQNASPEVEVFLQGKGLPVTDLEFGKDGAMYFLIGGRGTQAALYRVSHTAPAAAAGPLAATTAGSAERKLRHELEAFHGAPNSAALAAAWPHLGHPDRVIRYAARLAIEAQPARQWRDRAIAETNPVAALNALLGLARVGAKEDQLALFQALTRIPLDQLDEEGKLNKLRVIQVSFSRHGRPSDEIAALAVEKLAKQYPAKSYALNHELSQLLVFLDAPDVVAKTLDLLASSQDPAEQIWFAFVLREAKTWAPGQREKYFAWFNQAGGYKGGNSFAKFILRIREQALAKVSESERTQLASLSTVGSAPKKPAPVEPRAFVKPWTMADLTPELNKIGGGRNFARGKAMYSAAQCAQCHQFGPERGGNVGPDITAVGNRFNRNDLLESIIDPSKAVSEQYASVIVSTKAGETFVGQVAEENNFNLILVTDPVAGTKTTITKASITSREMSPASLMPPGLLNTLNKEEILDLLAYLESGGNEKAPMFSAK